MAGKALHVGNSKWVLLDLLPPPSNHCCTRKTDRPTNTWACLTQWVIYHLFLHRHTCAIHAYKHTHTHTRARARAHARTHQGRAGMPAVIAVYKTKSYFNSRVIETTLKTMTHVHAIKAQDEEPLSAAKHQSCPKCDLPCHSYNVIIIT